LHLKCLLGKTKLFNTRLISVNNQRNRVSQTQRIGMTEVEENKGVIEQEAAAPVEATESKPPVSTEPKEPEAGTKEYNWRRMEQKVQELERKNQEMSQTMQDKAPPKEEKDELSQLQEDDLITVGQVNKLAEQRARQIVSDELAKREQAALPGKVKGQYDDYDQVVTNENIEKLVQERSAWENTIKNDPNPYETAYYLIKQSKFYKESNANKQNQEKIASNSQKPVSSNTIGKQGPLAQAQAFATQSKADLWAEMQKYSKRAASVPYMR